MVEITLGMYNHERCYTRVVANAVRTAELCTCTVLYCTVRQRACKCRFEFIVPLLKLYIASPKYQNIVSFFFFGEKLVYCAHRSPAHRVSTKLGISHKQEVETNNEEQSARTQQPQINSTCRLCLHLVGRFFSGFTRWVQFLTF